MHEVIKTDPWVIEILVDPLSKDELSIDYHVGIIKSKYGKKYKIQNGIFDLRLVTSSVGKDSPKWKKGQEEYEKFAALHSIQDSKQTFLDEFEGVKDVYENIPIKGRCLDVGGGIGTLRAFLSKDQEYLSCDPFINAFDNISTRKNLLSVYPFLIEPVNFICCFAEHLPIASNSFDTVHMRSVIDHFKNPELALREAFRVLRNDGELIIGLTVLGGKTGVIIKNKESIRTKIKRTIKKLLAYLNIEKYSSFKDICTNIDYHIWHPTLKELVNLIEHCDFVINNVYWQKRHIDKVCYIKAKKNIS